MLTTALLIGAALFQDSLSFTDRRWELQGDSTRVVTVGGRPAVAMISGAATRRDLRLQDGTIDVDVMTTRLRTFMYVKFRVQDDAEYEEFYLRPHKSDLPDATQYAPVFRGQSAWQLYHGERGTSSPPIAPGEWQHLRLVMSGNRLAVFLRDMDTPVLDVALARTPAPGYIALSAGYNAALPATGPSAWFSNVNVRPGYIPYRFPARQAAPLPSGVISKWTLGPAFIAGTLEPTAIDPAWRSTSQVVDVEPNGMVELNRWLPMPREWNPSARRDLGVLARVIVHAEADGVRALQLGFSDAVTLFLNGTPLMHDDDSYLFPQRRDGLIGFDQATIYLPLKKGANELSLVVTDHFGGMGVMARFPDMRGLRLTP